MIGSFWRLVEFETRVRRGGGSREDCFRGLVYSWINLWVIEKDSV